MIRCTHRKFCTQSLSKKTHLFDAVRRMAPQCRIIYLSSAAVYGNPSHLPISEDAQINPKSPYGQHKWITEEMGRSYNRLYDMGFCSVRVFSAYGRGLHRQVIYDIITALRNAHVQEQPILFHGTGEETRDFIHAADVAEAVLCVLRRASFQGEFYNVGSGKATRIRDLVVFIQEIIGAIHIPVLFRGRVRSGEVQHNQADISKLKELGFNPKWNFSTGITEIIQYFDADHRS